MNAVRKEGFVDRLPDKVEIQNAEQLVKLISSQRQEDGGVQFELADPKGEVQPITLTPAISESLLEVLRLVASGRGFTLVPVKAELTTKQAADYLNVSRPHLVKLLEQGDIPFHKVGRHRRILAENLFAYRDKRNDERKSALDELAELDREAGLF
ncbi:helix-turn-helix domain-containing protein [Thalassovita aquimarina]|uniref:Helix-turn-helix domain-containing protein n=1 Tax=Thalassovita aquimarina TaxID=2785917 RepID=A0ABS5HX29_9RHOB|nr:helix-turn-helix domain-containing protein [Thalassovita aquimarina]MBR9653550.1 helix-turn-helix domain-containing protein [Thalassovita aquimarina]